MRQRKKEGTKNLKLNDELDEKKRQRRMEALKVMEKLVKEGKEELGIE